MTLTQFETTGFYRDMKILYRGREHFLLSVDFDSEELEISEKYPEFFIEDEDRVTVRYFECEIVTNEQPQP